MQIPTYLSRLGNESKEIQLWLNSLPGIIEKLKSDWKLKIGEPYVEHVSCSFVAPCLVDGNPTAIIKIGLPHKEALDEIDGLLHLNGNPTVRIFRFDKNTNSMLLEECNPGTHLKEEPELYQDQIVSQLLNEIWGTNLMGTKFRPLSQMVREWNLETTENLNNFPDAQLAILGCELKDELIESTNRDVLLATDLHAGNILKAERREWLAIDIKPYIGDPAYDITQHIMNCLSRFSTDPEEFIERISKLAQVDGRRLRKWMQARLFSENDGISQKIGLKLNKK